MTPETKALLIRLGCIPPDTEFNRRAKAYAQESVNLALSREYQREWRRKKREVKHDPHHGAEVCEETSGEECGTDSAAKV